jgi:hypothetical protein
VGEETWNTRRIWVDGQEQADKKLYLQDDGRKREVLIEIG